MALHFILLHRFRNPAGTSGRRPGRASSSSCAPRCETMFYERLYLGTIGLSGWVVAHPENGLGGTGVDAATWQHWHGTMSTVGRSIPAGCWSRRTAPTTLKHNGFCIGTASQGILEYTKEDWRIACLSILKIRQSINWPAKWPT